MQVTLLGTGDATGVPAPLCDCEYCAASDRRRRPAILVETDEARLLFDAGPDINEQLASADVRDVDAVFLTHAHGDHSAGLAALSQTAKWDGDHLDRVDDLEPTPADFDPGYRVYLTETARGHVDDRHHSLWLRFAGIDHRETVAVGNCAVTAVPVEHARPTFDTLGFVVDDGDRRVCYAPDVRRWYDGPPAEPVDLLVCEGAAVLGQPVHGPADELRDAIEAVDADRVVLVNVNEHLQRAHTADLRERASEPGYELGEDFVTVRR